MYFVVKYPTAICICKENILRSANTYYTPAMFTGKGNMLRFADASWCSFAMRVEHRSETLEFIGVWELEIIIIGTELRHHY